MTKRIILATLIAVFTIVFIIGCGEDTTSSIEPPSSLQLTGATNETDLVLTWSPSPTEDIDGYRIYLGTTLLADEEDLTPTTTTWTHIAPTTVGEYKVVAVRDDEESPAATASTEPYEDTGELYDFDTPSDQGYSGWGWNWTTGVGAFYSFSTDNASEIDMYYDSDNTLTSADYYSEDFPNTTGFIVLTNTYDNVGNVPTEGYANSAPVGEGQVYAIVIMKDHTDEWHYAKLRIDSYSASPYDRITFTYAYQTVKNFSLLD
ncbi:hypothetical protein J7M00_02845 [bacterium]|nr:hypothetical protein [bacterium]